MYFFKNFVFSFLLNDSSPFVISCGTIVHHANILFCLKEAGGSRAHQLINSSCIRFRLMKALARNDSQLFLRIEIFCVSDSSLFFFFQILSLSSNSDLVHKSQCE